MVEESASVDTYSGHLARCTDVLAHQSSQKSDQGGEGISHHCLNGVEKTGEHLYKNTQVDT